MYRRFLYSMQFRLQTIFLECTLRKLFFHFLSHLMGYDRGDSFPFDFGPNRIPFGSKNQNENFHHDQFVRQKAGSAGGNYNWFIQAGGNGFIMRHPSRAAIFVSSRLFKQRYTQPHHMWHDTPTLMWHTCGVEGSRII